MASFKLNMATIKGCPDTSAVQDLMEKFGMPDREEYGVLTHSGSGNTVTATLVHKTVQKVQKVDPKSKEVSATMVEKANLIPFRITAAAERLEVFAGAARNIEHIGAFLTSCLALPIVVDEIEMDVLSAIDKLRGSVNRFQLKSIKVSDYAADSYSCGAYGPKFMTSEHGREFAEKYAAGVVSAAVKFAGPTGKVGVTLRPDACLAYSCNEDDAPVIQSILRKLIWTTE